MRCHIVICTCVIRNHCPIKLFELIRKRRRRAHFCCQTKSFEDDILVIRI